MTGRIPGSERSWWAHRRAVALVLVASTCGSDCSDGGARVLPTHESYDRELVRFDSDGVGLTGILWTPREAGPHPALVLVDGSGRTTAEAFEPWVRRFARWGFASLSYDKRGVGDSGGSYIGGYDIDVPQLGRDAAAAADLLARRPEVDPDYIGFLGTSQAGWVIPVAATETPNASFFLIFSGTTVSLGEERTFSRLSGDDPFWGWIHRDLSLEEISRRMADERPSLFDPEPYLRRLETPGLWLFGSLDRSQPTRASLRVLDELISVRDRPFSYRVFDGADHSLFIDGDMAPDVFPTMREWLTAQVTPRGPEDAGFDRGRGGGGR